MGALASAIFKIRLFSTRNFLTFYYCQADVSTRDGKIILTLSTRNIKILTRPLLRFIDKFFLFTCLSSNMPNTTAGTNN